jgi:hypothetical protein
MWTLKAGLNLSTFSLFKRSTMRHSQQPTVKPETDLVTALVQGLSPEHRRAFMDAAAQNRLLELIDLHQQSTIDDFFRAVQADAHWPLLRNLLLSDVISSTLESASTPPSTATLDRDLATDERRQMRLAIPAGSGEEKTIEPVVSRAASGRKRGGDILDDIVTLLATEPGLRNEQIQKHLGKPALLVKSSLAALRKSKRVRTEGERRATRYFAATSA